MSNSYHPENLLKCEFTGRLSRNLVRSSFDRLTYDRCTVLEKRGKAPPSQEIRNQRTGSLVVPVTSQFDARRQLDPITKQEKLQIDEWVSQEKSNMSSWLSQNQVHGYFDDDSPEAISETQLRLSERIVREPDNLVLLRLVFFSCLSLIKGKPTYSRGLEVCFKLLAAQINQNKLKINPVSLSPSENNLTFLQDKGFIPRLVNIPADSIRNVFSFLNYKDISSFLSSSKNFLKTTQKSSKFKDDCSSICSSIAFCYEMDLQNFYLQRDRCLVDFEFLLDSSSQASLTSLFDKSLSGKSEVYYQQRKSILDYRSDRVSSRKSKAIERQLKELAPELMQRELKVEKDLRMLDEQRKKLADERRAIEAEKSRLKLLQKIFDPRVISSRQVDERYGLDRFTEGSGASVGEQVAFHSVFASLHNISSQPTDVASKRQIGLISDKPDTSRSVKRSKSVPNFSCIDNKKLKDSLSHEI